MYLTWGQDLKSSLPRVIKPDKLVLTPFLFGSVGPERPDTAKRMLRSER